MEKEKRICWKKASIENRTRLKWSYKPVINISQKVTPEKSGEAKPSKVGNLGLPFLYRCILHEKWKKKLCYCLLFTEFFFLFSVQIFWKVLELIDPHGYGSSFWVDWFSSESNPSHADTSAEMTQYNHLAETIMTGALLQNFFYLKNWRSATI